MTWDILAWVLCMVVGLVAGIILKDVVNPYIVCATLAGGLWVLWCVRTRHMPR